MRNPRFVALLSALSLFGAACGEIVLQDNNKDGIGVDPPLPPGSGACGPGTGQGASGQGAMGASGQGAMGASGQGASGAGNPGSSGNCGQGASGASGQGGSGTGGDPGPPQCADAEKRCEHTFTYPAGAEASVELRGDYKPGGWASGAPMVKQGSSWTVTVKIPWDTDVQYKFVINGSNWVTDPNNASQVSDGQGGFNSLLAGETCAEWTCEPAVIGTFDWRDAVMYFVFVDRFVDGDPSNNGAPINGVSAPASYMGGDWKGVKDKVEAGYFNDLGINTLWLTVPVDNTEQGGMGSDNHLYSAYHGYWPKDLTAAEEHFGTKAEFKALVDAAHQKGLKVVLDYAMNHVHISSPVYAQHPDWFWPLSDGQVNNCTCGGGCSWEGAQGKRCWFTSYLPDFNFTNAAARDYSVNNALQWIKDTGIDGFRLDAVKHIEDSWLLDLRSRVTSEIESVTNEHFYMVGETFTGDQGLIKYYVNPGMLDGQFDFPLRAVLTRAVLMRAGDTPMSALDNFLKNNEGYYGAGVMSTFVGNHDVPRPIHYAEDQPLWSSEWDNGKDRSWQNLPNLPSGNNAFERLANAFTVLYTTKGIPLVYYGDEVGMAGGGDPDNRRMMAWSGYAAGQTKLLNHVKKLGAIRAAHEALRKGSRQSLSADNDTMVYKMSGGGDTVFIAVNRSDQSKTVNVTSGTLTDELTGESKSGSSVDLPPRSSRILVP